ncbi:GMP synthase [bacterium]|nr:MAG: GMP synthase [bacterium]
MKIGILNTDALKPEFVAVYGEYPDMFAKLLLAVDPKLELVTYEILRDEYPQDINEVDGYVITGSKLSVYDDVPWINKLKSFVRELHAAKKKTVGICFGHQLIAEALGGKTAQAEQGWCVGVQTTTFTGDASRFGTAGSAFQLISNHKDQVQELPEGGTLLASTESCPMAMTSIGNHILSFQGHPEFSKEYARALLDMRREIFGESVYQAAVDSLQQRDNSEQVANWILEFIAD